MSEMRDYSRQRKRSYAQYRKLLIALKSLFESDILEDSEYETTRKRIDEHYHEVKKQRIANRPPPVRQRGRPLKAQTSCRKPGCGKPAVNGYCSIDHAPLGNLWLKLAGGKK